MDRRTTPDRRTASLDQGTAPTAHMTPKEASTYTGYSVRTLEKWRKTGQGPQFVLRNGRVCYRRDLLDSWLAEPWVEGQRTG